MQYIVLYYLLLLISAHGVHSNEQLQAKILQKQSQQVLQHLNQIQSSENKLQQCTSAKEQNSTLATTRASSDKDCSEIYNAGYKESDTYIIRLFHGAKSLAVYCDMATLGIHSNKRGWISIQRRWDGSLSFNHGWKEYLEGFGSPESEHWIGLSNIHFITEHRMKIYDYEESPNLGIKMEDWDGIKAYKEFKTFAVGPEWNNFRIEHLAHMSTNKDMGLLHGSINKPFSTHDFDPDAEHRHFTGCMKSQTGGWWFGNCLSNLNGRYPSKHEKSSRRVMYAGELWYRINPKNTALRRATMMLQWS